MQDRAQKPNYEVRVGMFTVIALLMLLYGWGWLKSVSLFHQPQEFIVQFHDVAGLNKNATVNINGVRVGIIENIELKAKGQVLVHTRITDEHVVVTEGSKFTIQTLGMVGAKYLEVTLPEEKPGQQSAEPLQPDQIVVGEDPVRIELVMNDVGTFLRSIVHGMNGEHTGHNFGVAIRNISEASAKLNKDLDNFRHAADSVTSAGEHINDVAAAAKSTAISATRFFTSGGTSLHNVDQLTGDLRGTTRKINKILDRPLVSSDLKEIVDKAKAASEQVAAAVREINGTLKDKGTREDMLTIMDRLSKSTENIAQSVHTINSLANDNQLRGDIKDTVASARAALDKANNLLNSPNFPGDIRSTMSRARTAATDVDIAARQMQQILNSRAPLMRMMFGRPGKLKKAVPDNDSTSDSNRPGKLKDYVPPGRSSSETSAPAAHTLERLGEPQPTPLPATP